MGQTAKGGSLAVFRSPFSVQALSPATIDHYHGGRRAFLCQDVATVATPPAFVSLDTWWAWEANPGFVSNPENWISACWFTRSGKHFRNPVANPWADDGSGSFADLRPPAIHNSSELLLDPEETSFCQRTPVDKTVGSCHAEPCCLPRWGVRHPLNVKRYGALHEGPCGVGGDL